MRAYACFVVPVMLAATALAQDTPERSRLVVDAPAPEIGVVTLEGKGMTLANLRAANPGKVIVLQFGSITDPIFRAHVATVEKAAVKESDKALFVIVYQKEAHPDSDPLEVNANAGFNLPAPATLAARQTLAQQAIDQLHISAETVVVDGLSDATSRRYGGLPNMTFVIDAKGNLAAGYPFMDPAKVQAAVEALAAGKALPEALRGSMQGNGFAAFDSASAAMDMTGGRGPASIASVIERSTLTDQQKQNVLVAIAEYMANVQDFRAARGGVVSGVAGGAGTAPARAGVGGAGNGGGSGGATTATRPATPADVQAAQTTLRSSADHVKGVIKQNMSAKDAAALFTALDTMVPAQRLFANP